MILDAYYKLQHYSSKSKTRFDVVASTKNYLEFEQMKNKKGELFFYYSNVPEHFRSEAKRKADKIISNRLGKNVSSVFVPTITLPFAYGDVKGTNDALLLLFSNDETEIEIFIAKGKKSNRLQLYHLLSDGELRNEIEMLRGEASNIKVI